MFTQPALGGFTIVVLLHRCLQCAQCSSTLLNAFCYLCN